ncbi:MAG: TetR/AcrR family transcriptional regulator, partial [Candidatus Binatia bacterium]
RELFAQSGYAAVSRAEIARRAGYGMSTIYHHFADKRDILLQLIDEWGMAMPVQRRAAFDIRTALGGDPRRAAREFLQKSLDQIEKGPSFYRVILTEAERDPEVRRRYETAQHAITTWLADMMRLGQQAGVVRPERAPDAAARLMHHVMESALTDLVTRKLARPAREHALEELTDMICSYLIVDRVRPAR